MEATITKTLLQFALGSNQITWNNELPLHIVVKLAYLAFSFSFSMLLCFVTYMKQYEIAVEDH